MTTSLDLSALTTLLGHLGCHEPAARSVDAIEVWENRRGHVVLSNQSERFTGDLDWVLRRLSDLEAGCGAEEVFATLNDDDDVDDDGQPDSLQERQDFAQDDDWREREVENFDPFDGE